MLTLPCPSPARLTLAIVFAAASLTTAGRSLAQLQDTGSGFNTNTTSLGGRTVTPRAASRTPITTTTSSVRTTPTVSSASGSSGGFAPVLFIRNSAELDAILSTAFPKPPAPPADAKVVQGLVESIAGADAARQETAARQLADLGETAVVPLVEILKDDQTPPAQRSAAAQMLAVIGPAAAPAMASLLKHPDTAVRLMTAQSLGAIGHRACLQPLMDALADSDPAVRLAAAQGLGRVGQAEATLRLAQVLAKDTATDVRAAAAESIGRAAPRAAVEPLIVGLSDPQVRVRQASARALVSLSEVLASGSRGELGRVKTADALLGVLSDKDPTLRATAAEGLGALRDSRAVEPLITALSDPAARLAAIRSLGRIGGEQARTTLRQLAEESPDSDIRHAATEAIASMRKR